jgi:fumarate hydratase class II
VKGKNSMKNRSETDSMGKVSIPGSALYSAQTQRAIDNFPISGLQMPEAFIRTIVMIKRAAAITNAELGLLEKDISQAIVTACDSLTDTQYREQFPVDVFQTGSATSTHMNVNEVLANLASARLKTTVHPNDHVNVGQSSNDVIPTAIHLSAALAIKNELLPALSHLHKTLLDKARSCRGIVKTGRTHLMDAMPIRMEQEIDAWGQQVQSAIERIESSLPRLYKLALGGTAVGTGINAHPEFSKRTIRQLCNVTALPLVANKSFFESLSCQDSAVEMSGQLKVAAVSLTKIANDLRWMNSGPLTGLGEIELEALQPGSSIMPGKVNPVIPEAVAMVAAQVIGNDTTITIAGQSGNFQLNVMLPVIAYNLLQSITLIGNGSRLLADKAIRSFSIKNERLSQSLALNPILVTALNPLIGYELAARIAKTAYGESRPIIDVAVEMTDLSRDELQLLLNPINLTGD